MNLTGEQLRELRALVLTAITDQDDLVRLVSERMGIRLWEKVKPARLDTVVFELISWLEAEGRTAEFVKALIAERPHLEEKLAIFRRAERPSSPRLTYLRSTAIDPECIPALLNSAEPPRISYFKSLADAMTKLAIRDAAPEDFFRQYPRIEEMDSRQRTERASQEHARNGDLLRRTEMAAERNETALCRLLRSIRDLNASGPLAAASLRTFAALVALYMIRELKKGYDWVEGRTQPWFESFRLGSDGSGSLLDCVPNLSATGRLVFGYRCWVMAHAGHDGKHRDVMFPLKFVLPLFREGQRGHAEAFFTWVLPQMVLNDFPVEDFPVADWEAFCLSGAGGREWQNSHHKCPWPDIVNGISNIEL